MDIFDVGDAGGDKTFSLTLGTVTREEPPLEARARSPSQYSRSRTVDWEQALGCAFPEIRNIGQYK